MSRLKPSKTDLLDGFRKIGLQKGNVVYIASSLASLGLMDNPVDDTLWALREVVGNEGTLIMPTFNFGFCQGDVFDRENTPSSCGVLSEAFRQLPDAFRTWSPAYHSVSVVGAKAQEISEIVSITSFGRDSVFQYLHDIDCKQLLIGCGYEDGVAHFHWLEELHEVPYRYWKKFEGEVVLDGKAIHRSFFMFARRLEITPNADLIGEKFEQSGLVKQTDIGLCRLRAFDIKDFKGFIEPYFVENPLAIIPESQKESLESSSSPVTGIDHIAIASRYSQTKFVNF